MQDGAHWKSLRRFTLKALRDFGVGKSTLEEKIKHEVDFVLAEFDNKKGMPFDPKEIFDKAVSNIICSIIFGQRSVLFFIIIYAIDMTLYQRHAYVLYLELCMYKPFV